MRTAFVTMLLSAVGGGACAQQADEEVLKMLDSKPAEVRTEKPFRLFAEVGASHVKGTDSGPGHLLGLDFRGVWHIDTDLRLNVSDRFDVASGPTQSSETNHVNTLREFYLDWRAAPDQLFQMGRVNIRQGVALGYNPSDFFRGRALRAAMSIDPKYQRANRMGIVGLAGNWFGQNGAGLLVLAPRLRHGASDSPFSLDVGATNGAHQILGAWTQVFTEDIKPQASFYLRENAHPQVGLQGTTLLNNRTVAYAEMAGGKSRSMSAQALGWVESPRWHTRLSSGLTYTTDHKLSLTLEYNYNGTGLDASDWRALRNASAMASRSVLLLASQTLDPPSRHSWFMNARWEDAVIPNVDLTAFLRTDGGDGSHQLGLELRYPGILNNEFILQMQLNRGKPDSVFGTLNGRTIVTAFIQHDFSY